MPRGNPFSDEKEVNSLTRDVSNAYRRLLMGCCAKKQAIHGVRHRHTYLNSQSGQPDQLLENSYSFTYILLILLSLTLANTFLGPSGH
jgi:hypothetical protein